MLYGPCVKRAMDFILCAVAIIFLFPLLLALGVTILITLGRPVLFKQERVGKGEKLFTIYKFRTMKNIVDDSGILIGDEMRKTRFGDFIRSTSLDELPELFNILFGDLSIVGPRPLLKEYLDCYYESEKCRHQVRPGLIPPDILLKDLVPSWDDQLRYDAYYASNVSLPFDLKIFFTSFIVLFNRVGTNYGEQVRTNLVEERKGAN